MVPIVNSAWRRSDRSGGIPSFGSVALSIGSAEKEDRVIHMVLHDFRASSEGSRNFCTLIHAKAESGCVETSSPDLPLGESNPDISSFYAGVS
jgi:hypothetical protein